MKDAYKQEVSNWLIYNNNDYQRHLRFGKHYKKNSRELVNILRHNCEMKQVDSLLELGCGQGRNLYFIIRRFPHISIFGNDLIKDVCFKHMRSAVRKKNTFFYDGYKVFFRKKVYKSRYGVSE